MRKTYAPYYELQINGKLIIKENIVGEAFITRQAVFVLEFFLLLFQICGRHSRRD